VLEHLSVLDAIDIVEVGVGSEAIGKNPVTLNLRHRTGAAVVAVFREDDVFYTPDPAFAFEPGDAAILVGSREARANAQALFAQPRPPGPSE
jgi:K+/H+ antiporter YhaU regulatory subunit KhtT